MNEHRRETINRVGADACLLTSVGARVVEWGRVGLYGRPRGVSWPFIDEPASPDEPRRATIKAHPASAWPGQITQLVCRAASDEQNAVGEKQVPPDFSMQGCFSLPSRALAVASHSQTQQKIILGMETFPFSEFGEGEFGSVSYSLNLGRDLKSAFTPFPYLRLGSGHV